MTVPVPYPPLDRLSQAAAEWRDFDERQAAMPANFGLPPGRIMFIAQGAIRAGQLVTDRDVRVLYDWTPRAHWVRGDDGQPRCVTATLAAEYACAFGARYDHPR